ncbi:MAG TPA: hypothetical protein PK156_00300 [Polyangium sp.]|nr:hypothetical protein [Polyangium sp.]
MSQTIELWPHIAGRSGTPVEWRRVTLALHRRRRFVIGAAIVGMVAGGTIAKTLVEPVFEAQCLIECDRCARPELGERELATLQETVKLPQHLQFAKDKLKLATTLDRIDTNVQVSASLESRLIQVTARENAAELAANLANLVVDAFLETRLLIEKDILDAHVRRLQTDYETARSAVVAARENYDRFRQENNISDLATERQAAIQEAARLHSELAMAQGEEQAERARALALHRATAKEPSTAILLQTEDLPDAKKLSEVKSQLIAAQARFSPDHPKVRALRAEAEVLETKVAAANEAVATGRTVGPNPQKELANHKILEANANQQAANTRQSTYEKLAQSAARAAARLSSIEGRVAELSFHLETAERHTAAIALDMKAAEDAARAPSTGLRILARARAPRVPIESSRKVAAILGPLVGSLLAVLFIALGELRGLRLHTSSELTFWGQRPTIAASTWPHSAAEFEHLVAGLAASIRQSRGKTIIIGLTNDELPHVRNLVQGILVHSRVSSASIASLPTSASYPELRHAMRDAARVLLLVTAGKHTGSALSQFVEKIAYSGPMAFILIGLQEEHVSLPDLIGDVDEFWSPRRTNSRRFGKLAVRRRRPKHCARNSA